MDHVVRVVFGIAHELATTTDGALILLFRAAFVFHRIPTLQFPIHSHSQIIICSIGIVHINLHLLPPLPGPALKLLDLVMNYTIITIKVPFISRAIQSNSQSILQKNNSLKVSSILNTNLSDRQPDYGFSSSCSSTINTLLPFLLPPPETDGSRFSLDFE